MSASKRSIPPELRAVFFDLDDTLFDHAGTRRAALRTVLPDIPGARAAGLSSVDERYQRLVEELHPRVLSGELTRAKARALRFRSLADSLGSSLTSRDARDLGRRYAQAYRAARRAHPGAADLLRHLRATLTVGVISNNLVAEQHDKIRAIGLSGLIDPLVISGAVGVNKPDPRIFQEALRRAACRANEAIMIGDSWTNDVEGARAAGLATVWFHPDDRTPRRKEGVPALRSFRPTEIAGRRIRTAHRRFSSSRR